MEEEEDNTCENMSVGLTKNIHLHRCCALNVYGAAYLASTLKFVSNSPALQLRWPVLLKYIFH
jgi:hypothetical protein